MNKTFKKVLGVVLAIIMIIALSAGTTLFVNKYEAIQTSTTVKNGLSAYEIAVSEGYKGSLQDWLGSLKGKSAFEIAKESGFSGTEEEYGKLLNKLATSDPVTVKTASFNKDGQLVITLSDDTIINAGNAVGLAGKDGADGKNGINGKDGIGIINANINSDGELVLSFSDEHSVNVGKVVGATGVAGKDGLSAYQIAVVSGATSASTESEWIASLKGEKGDKGDAGAQGDKGDKGDTGAQGEKGEKGNKGEKGDIGNNGKSAYDIAVDNGCTLSESEWIESLKGEYGTDGKSAYEIAKNAGLTNAATEFEWIESLKGEKGDKGDTGAQGEKGDKGDTGAQGEKGAKGDKGDTGAAGKSAYELAIDNGFITKMVTETQWLNSLKGEKGDKGDTGAQGNKGEKGDKGDSGLGIQNITLVDGKMTVTLTDSSTYVFENLNGKDGVSPQIRINAETNKWEISTDNGTTWTSTNVNATGAQGDKGDKGDTGAQGEKGDKGDTGAQGEKGDKGDTGAQGEKGDKGDTGAQGEKGDKGDTGAQGEKGDKGDAGSDGITPIIQINSLTNEWEISVNNGLSFESTGIKATGAKGDTGAQGEKGAKGDKGDKGDDGISVTGVSLNDENKLVITLSEGDPIVLDHSLMGATGAKGDKGDNGADGVSVTSVTLTADFCLVFNYSDGTNSGKLGPIKGDKGDKGDTGAQGEKGEKGDKGDTGADGVGITTVSVDKTGNLYITYSNTTIATLLGNVKGPKGDKGDKGDKGADGVDGKSAFELYQQAYPDYTGTYTEWLASLKGEKGDAGKGILSTLYENGKLTINYTDGTKDEYLIKEENQGTEGLDYYLLPDGTYGVKAGKTQYLTSVVIPEKHNGKKVSKVLKDAFKDDLNLVEISLPTTITDIEESAFSGCINLSAIIIPEGVEQIGDYSFYGCNNATTLTLPSTLTHIGLFGIVKNGSNTYENMSINCTGKWRMPESTYSPNGKVYQKNSNGSFSLLNSNGYQYNYLFFDDLNASENYAKYSMSSEYPNVNKYIYRGGRISYFSNMDRID